MAKCQDCNQEMLESDTCTIKQIKIGRKIYDRDFIYTDYNKRCHDCGIINGHGHIHHFGCDVERCPKCGGQLISCGHKAKLIIPEQSEVK